jgi:hypothetical protein
MVCHKKKKWKKTGKCQVVVPPADACFGVGSYCTKTKHCCSRACDRLRSWKCLASKEMAFMDADFTPAELDLDESEDEAVLDAVELEEELDAERQRRRSPVSAGGGPALVETGASSSSVGAFIAGAVCAALVTVGATVYGRRSASAPFISKEARTSSMDALLSGSESTAASAASAALGQRVSRLGMRARTAPGI